MALHLTENTTIEVATVPVAPAAAVFHPVLKIDTHDVDHSSEEDEEHYWYGEDDPDVFAGDDEDTYSISGGHDPEDTTGQAIIITARRDRTPILLRVMNGDLGEEQRVRVTRYHYNGERNGDDWESVDFDFKGYGAVTAVDLSA